MIEFTKMHGLGNDFVLLDGRQMPINLSSKQIKIISDRHLGIGCDQIMIMHPAQRTGDIYLQILNADGSEANACGNGTRCVASVLLSELKENAGLSNKKWDKAIKGLSANKLAKVNKSEDGLFVQLLA